MNGMFHPSKDPRHPETGGIWIWNEWNIERWNTRGTQPNGEMEWKMEVGNGMVDAIGGIMAGGMG